MTTLSTLRTRVRNSVGDRSSSFLSNSTIDQFINEGIRELAVATKALTKYETVSISSATFTTTDEYITILHLSNLSDDTEVKFTTLNKIANDVKDLEKTGIPCYFFEITNQTLQTWPVRTTAQDYRIIYSYVPAELSADANPSPFDNTFDSAIETFAIYKSKEYSGDTEEMVWFKRKFKDQVGELIARADNLNDDTYAAVQDYDPEVWVYYE